MQQILICKAKGGPFTQEDIQMMISLQRIEEELNFAPSTAWKLFYSNASVEITVGCVHGWYHVSSFIYCSIENKSKCITVE